MQKNSVKLKMSTVTGSHVSISKSWNLPNKHHAIQILLGDRVIHTENKGGKDDDTPGIKFWYYSEYERKLLVAIFEKALAELAKPEAKGE